MRIASTMTLLLLVAAPAVFAQPQHPLLAGDVSRIESILGTSQDANLPQSALVPMANEANALANRIVGEVHRALRGNTAAIEAARQLRAHIRDMRNAAAAGDTASVQNHAKLALPFAYQIDDLL